MNTLLRENTMQDLTDREVRLLLLQTLARLKMCSHQAYPYRPHVYTYTQPDTQVAQKDTQIRHKGITKSLIFVAAQDGDLLVRIYIYTYIFINVYT